MSKTLAASFRRASDRQRRQAVLTTSLLAVSQTGLRGDEIESTLDILRRGEVGEVTMQRQLESLSQNLDDRYLQLSKEDDQATKLEALLLFQKARAAAALAFAISSESENLHEAIYEAIVASTDPTETIRSAMMALNSK
jgi:hypothetical protein